MTLALVALMPIVLGFLFFLGRAYLTLVAHAATEHACQVQLLKTQTVVAELLEQLLALNSLAESLRAERLAAEIEVEQASGFPPALAIALAHLNSVVARQTALAAQQRRLLALAELQSRSGAAIALAHTQAAWSRLASTPSSVQASGHGGPLNVEARPAGDLTPSYAPAPNFSERQTVLVRWKEEMLRLFPHWIPRLPGPDRLANSCAATIKMKEGKWQAVLTVDRP